MREEGVGAGWLHGGRAWDDLLDALGSASTNRLESDDDERAVIEAAREALEGQGRSDLSRALDPVGALVSRTREVDERLDSGEQPTSGEAPSPVVVNGPAGD